MTRRKIDANQGLAAVREILEAYALAVANDEPFAFPESNDQTFATAIRFLLEDLANRVPGNSVEVRVPPLGAIQCIPGPTHTRGTPPNVVEMPADIWFELATGITDWSSALATGKVHASGTRADLSAVLPVIAD
jgi:hypothetical protein